MNGARQGQGGDPREREPRPPFPQQRQELPGSEAQMQPQPDFGEQSYRGSSRLTGKAAIITGGDSGIGRAVALAFAREGADVLIAYLSEDRDAQETRRLVESAGRRALTVKGDLADEAHCQQIVQAAVSQFGHLDILVNNAAHQAYYQHVTDIPSADFEHHFRVNIFAMFYLVKAAVPHMQPGAAIINTTSIQSFHPAPILLPYASTKGAITTFTMSLAQMLAQNGIRVNAVAPGPVWTPLIPAGLPEKSVPEFGKDTPLGRPAQPAELAPVYVHLASDEASYTTGQIYGVTGGKPLI